MQRTKLDLSIGSIFYPNLSGATTDKSRVYNGFTAFEFISANCGVHVDNLKYLQYRVIKDIPDLLVIDINVANFIKYITVNNEIGAIIFNCNDNNIKLICDALIRGTLDDKSGYTQSKLSPGWTIFINTVYNKIKSQEQNKWKPIYVENYSIRYSGQKTEIWGGKDRNNNILIGFNISREYNYFTGESHIYANTVTNNKIGKTVEKIDLSIKGEIYTIDLRDGLNSLRLFARLCEKYNQQNTKKLIYSKIDGYAISSDSLLGIYELRIHKKNFKKVKLRDNQGNIIDLDKLLLKMRMVDMSKTDKTYFKNIAIYDGVPNNKIINKLEADKYHCYITIV